MYLWGSNAEMGFAHGQLMGRQIVRLINDYLIKEASKGKYEEYYDNVNTTFSWPPGYDQELQGIIDGMDADGVDRWLEAAGRELDATDLKVWNTFGDWMGPAGQEFGCWRVSSEGGFPLAARNFYMYPDAQALGLYMWALVVYNDTNTGAQFLSVAPPGFIGVLTGASAKDVAVFANGVQDNEAQGGATGGAPMALLLREFLATTGPGSSDPDVHLLDMVSNNTNFGVWNLFGTTLNRGEELPGRGYSWVVECDSVGAVLRHASDNNPPPPHPPDALFAANGFRRLHYPPPNGPPNDAEYNQLVNTFKDYYDSGNNPIGIDDAMGILETVNGFDNACSVIFGYGPEGKLVLAFAVSDGVTPAAETWDYTKFRLHDFWQ